jgi:FlaA1/EpsC-like NDP-sugar epimerase
LIKKINVICSNIEVLPNKKNLISDTINLSDITSPIINNILNRKEIFFKKSYFNYLYKKNILITGAGGSIGSELFRQLTLLKVGKIIALDNSEISIYNLKKNRSESINLKYILGDISDEALIGKIIKDNKIDIIFHAAAYKHVPILENNLIAAVKNNIVGTINVLKNSLKFNCNFIFVSTDKAVRPCSNLGITKRIAEIICQGYKNNKKSSKINIVRFGNVLGSVGSAIPLFLEQINNNLPITITDRRVKRYFMTIKEACLLLLVSARYYSSKGTLILNMGKPVLLLDVIKKLINLRKKFTPNYDYSITKIGLSKGEKLVEELIINKKSVRVKNKIGILECSEPSYKFNEVQELISKIYFNLLNSKEKELSLLFNDFLKKEI